MLLLYLILAIFACGLSIEEDKFLGCYRTQPVLSFGQNDMLEQCIQQCKLSYYRFALMVDGFCACNNRLGERISSSKCTDNNLADVYKTGHVVPGPPKTLQIANVTSSSVRLTWQEPESYTDITSYLIRANVVHTYSTYSPMSREWLYSNTFSTELPSLQPGTKYNISIAAQSTFGSGVPISQLIQTLIDEPDNKPAKPQIVSRNGGRLTIKISPVINNNGPITSYLVVVIDEDSQQIFQKELLKSYSEARKEGINYYITAELSPYDIDKNFVVGDGRYYGKYFNAPLNPEGNYNILSGIVSRLNDITKISYSNLNDNQIIITQNETGDSPAVIIGLSIAIGLLSFMLVAGIIGFIIIRSKVTNYRQRLSDNQELTLQGPMIEVENNGYIPEEEHTKVNHYRNLKQKLKTIPYSQLKIEPTNLLGIGRFGRVNSGTIYENNTLVPVAVYSISDKKLNEEDKKSMLRELDKLIRSGKNDNVVALFGTCETPQLVFVILEYVSMNLKDLLLGSRDTTISGRFSNLNESQAFDIAVNVARGMAHLHKNNIVHKQLCARSVMISNNFVPKISGFGLAQFYSHNNLPDFTRWTALEVFKGQNPNAKSDVWSFACLLWEICVLGGTPYGNFQNNDIPERITKGLRLPQMKYYSDDLYQTMLDCWQIDMDERPNFDGLIDLLQEIQKNSLIPHLSFNLYPNFQYEQFYPDMEIAVRPVF